MLDFTAYQTIKHQLDGRAGEALPNSPVRPHNHESTMRHRVSVTLHRLAEWLDPHPPGHMTPVTAGCD